MKRIIKHNIKAAKLAWLETYTDRSRTLLQWLGDSESSSPETATTLSIRHDFKLHRPAPVGELLLPRKVGRAGHIPDHHVSNAHLNDGALGAVLRSTSCRRPQGCSTDVTPEVQLKS